MTFQAIAKSTNRASLVIGEITATEAEIARHDNPLVDGRGIYLISVDNETRGAIGNVLAKFVCADVVIAVAQLGIGGFHLRIENDTRARGGAEHQLVE